MNALQQWEDIATAVQLTDNNCTTYTDIILLDHLFQAIQQTEERLQWEKQCARYWIIIQKVIGSTTHLNSQH
jgi:hypothetical protein